MTGFTEDQKAALNAKLDASHVKKRDQGNTKVSYIEGWLTIAEANRIFGFDGWTRETVMSECCYSGEYDKAVWERGQKTDRTVKSFRCTYRAKVRVTVGDVVREGSGHGHGFGDNPGDAHESAEKEAETDAMKRALMTFGNPFGLALYDKTQENVEKAEPPAKVPAPPKAAEPPKPGEFWLRPSLELKSAKIKNLLDFAGAFEEACKKAPSLDLLLKLEQDNDAHLAALQGQSPSAHKQAKTIHGVEMQKFTQKAA